MNKQLNSTILFVPGMTSFDSIRKQQIKQKAQSGLKKNWFFPVAVLSYEIIRGQLIIAEFYTFIM